MSLAPVLVLLAVGMQPSTLKGLEVVSLDAQGAGNEVGLKASDVLISLDGHPLHTPFDLKLGEANVRRGDKVELVWQSEGVRRVAKIGDEPLGVLAVPVMAPNVKSRWMNARNLAEQKRFGEAMEQLESARKMEGNPVINAWLQYETALQRASGWDIIRAGDDFIASAFAFQLHNESRAVVATKRQALVFLAPLAFNSRENWNRVFDLAKDADSLKSADLRGNVVLERIRAAVRKSESPTPDDVAEARNYPGLQRDLEILLLASEINRAKTIGSKVPAEAQKVKAAIEDILERFTVQEDSAPDLIPVFSTLIGLSEMERPDPEKVCRWFLRCFAKAEQNVCILALDFATGFAALSFGDGTLKGPIKVETLRAIRQVAEERFPNTGVHASALFFESAVELSINPLAPVDGFRKAADIFENLDERVGYGLDRRSMLSQVYNTVVLRDLALNPNQAVDMILKRPKSIDPGDKGFAVFNELSEAVVLQVTGRRSDAQVAYRKAMKLYEAQGKDDPLLQRATMLIGVLMGGRPADSEIPLDLLGPELSSAFAVLVSGRGPERTTEAGLRKSYDLLPVTTLDREMLGTALATFALRRKAPEEALPYAREAHENFLRRRSELTMPEDRKRITEFAGGLAPVILAQTYLELDKPKEALEVLESVRARSLAESMLLDGTGFKDSQPMKDLLAAQVTRRRLADQYETSEASGREAARQELDKAIRDEEQAFKKLRDSDEKVRDFGYPEVLTGDAICQALGPDEVMATAVITDDRVWAIFADSKRIWAVKTPLLAKEIDGLVNQYAAACVSSYLSPLPPEVETGKRLYEALLGGIHDRIASGARVIIVPDSRFDRLPFAALPARGKYLIEWTSLRYEPSMTVMQVNRRRNMSQKAGSQWLFAGDPAYHEAGGLESKSTTDSKRFLPRLPETRTEILAISKGIPSTRKEVLLGAAASPSKILAALPNAGVVHLSCHGFNDRDRPLLSHLAFSPEFGNPSGTIRALDLFGKTVPAELVVLGACEVGGGQASDGEGVDGLARTLMHVGGKRVVGAIQKVPGQITADFLIEFYKGVQSGARIDEALRQAQIVMMRRPGSTPGHWAAFRLLGEGTALPPALLGKSEPQSKAPAMAVAADSRLAWVVAGAVGIFGCLRVGRRWAHTAR